MGSVGDGWGKKTPVLWIANLSKAPDCSEGFYSADKGSKCSTGETSFSCSTQRQSALSRCLQRSFLGRVHCHTPEGPSYRLQSCHTAVIGSWSNSQRLQDKTETAWVCLAGYTETALQAPPRAWRTWSQTRWKTESPASCLWTLAFPAA